MGLAEEYYKEGRGAKNRILGITPLGKSVAEKISEIADLVNKK